MTESSRFHRIPERTDAFNTDFHNIARLHGADSLWRSGADDISGKQGHALGNLITILFQPTLEVALALEVYEPRHKLTVGPCLPGQSYGQNGTGTQPGNEEYALC